MEEELTADDLKDSGLVDGHAYSLIEAKEITNSHGQQVRIVLIRNPWGKKEWNGDWSDKSGLWDEHTKA